MMKKSACLLLLLFGQLSFPGMVRPIEWVPICLSLEEVGEYAGHKVWVEGDHILMIAGHPQWILD
jgi:hypothetical protein